MTKPRAPARTAPRAAARVRVHHPESRLAKLVERPGGLPRAMAIARAAHRMDVQREPAFQEIGKLVSALEIIVTAGTSLDSLGAVRRITNQLIALAETYHMLALVEAGKRLSDLIAGFAATQSVCHASILVHARALRLLAADDAAPAVAENVLAELDKVLAHFRARPVRAFAPAKGAHI